MKSGSLSKLILAVILWVFLLMPFGCAIDQLGETTAQGHRRHRRVLRINRQEMMADIDRALLLDKPSRLTDKRIPYFVFRTALLLCNLCPCALF